MTAEELDRINKRLKERFGSLYDGRAHYRVSWAPDQREYRKGERVELNSSGTVKNRITGINYVRKYEWLGECFVIERLVPIGAYEEIRSDRQIEYELLLDLPKNKDPWFEAIEFAIRIGLEGPEKLSEEAINSKQREEDEEKYRREMAYFEEALAE